MDSAKYRAERLFDALLNCVNLCKQIMNNPDKSLMYLERKKMIQSVRSWIVIIHILYTVKGHTIDTEIVYASILGIQR